LRAEERDEATTRQKRRGRLERRTLVSTTALNTHLGWPGVRQVFRLVRERTVNGTTTREVVFGITSLSREQADAARLLELSQGHWGIENRLFWVRDMTFGEDACRVRTGSAPRNLAAIRNASISVLRAWGRTNLARALREHACRLDTLLTRLRIVKQ
jgi:predicted transposase YbfD/YdcC